MAIATPDLTVIFPAFVRTNLRQSVTKAPVCEPLAQGCNRPRNVAAGSRTLDLLIAICH